MPIAASTSNQLNGLGMSRKRVHQEHVPWRRVAVIDLGNLISHLQSWDALTTSFGSLLLPFPVHSLTFWMSLAP